MNYYIKGDAANADKIKAAFESKGYDARQFDYSCGLFVTCNNDKLVHYFSSNAQIANIFETHPDYKELELPVEPKFKVGDTISWIGHDCDTQKIVDIRKGSYITVDKYDVRCALKFTKQDEWELVPNPKPHYDIVNFHAGMPVLVREYDTCHWQWVLYSHFNGVGLFFAAGKTWRQCIPFNDGTKHLLGTTGMPDERFINW